MKALINFGNFSNQPSKKIRIPEQVKKFASALRNKQPEKAKQLVEEFSITPTEQCPDPIHSNHFTSALSAATMLNYPDVVEQLLINSIPPEETFNTALEYAVDADYFKVIEQLLMHASPNQKILYQHLQFSHTLQKKQPEEAQQLAKQFSINPNVKCFDPIDRYCNTSALEVATKLNYPEVVEQLLINSTPPAEILNNALKIAVNHGYPKIVEHLLAYASPDQKIFYQQLKFNLALKNEKPKKAQQLAEQYSINSNVQCSHPSNPYRLISALEAATMLNYPDVVEQLLSNSTPPIEIPNNVLEFAMNNGYFKIVKHLLAHISPDQEIFYQQLQFNLALKNKQPKKAQRLAEQFPINSELLCSDPKNSQYNLSALEVAADLNYPKVVEQLLINSIPSIKILNKTLKIAINAGYSEIVKQLLAHTSFDQEVLYAHLGQEVTWRHNIEVVKHLLGYLSIDLNKISFIDLNKIPYYNEYSDNKYRKTLLHIATERNHPDVVKELLFHISNPNPQDSDGQTPLHHASLKGYVKIVELLLKHPNIRVNIPNKKHKTALHYVVSQKNTIITELLLNDPTLDPTISDNEGKTAIQIADSNNQNMLIQPFVMHFILHGNTDMIYHFLDEDMTDDLQSLVKSFFPILHHLSPKHTLSRTAANKSLDTLRNTYVFLSELKEKHKWLQHQSRNTILSLIQLVLNHSSKEEGISTLIQTFRLMFYPSHKLLSSFSLATLPSEVKTSIFQFLALFNGIQIPSSNIKFFSGLFSIDNHKNWKEKQLPSIETAIHNSNLFLSMR